MSKKNSYQLVALIVLWFILIYLLTGRCDQPTAEIVSNDSAQSIQNHDVAVGKIVKFIINKKYSSQSDVLDRVRSFVFTHSVHDETAEKREDPAIAIWNHHEGKNSPPVLKCGSRARVMKELLDRLDIRNRIVHIFTDERVIVSSHTFLEAYNDDFQSWEIQDPDYDIYYIRNDESRQRLSVIDLIFGDLNAVVPCSGNRRGWMLTGASPLKDFFKAVMYDNDSRIVPPLILVNTGRLDLGRKFKAYRDHKNVKATFVEVVQRAYRRPVIVFDRPNLCRFLLWLTGWFVR